MQSVAVQLAFNFLDVFFSPPKDEMKKKISCKLEKLKQEKQVAKIQLVLSNALIATQAFSEKQFTRFDALVSDYGCQLRAIKIFDLACSKTFEGEVKLLGETALKANVQFQKALLLHQQDRVIAIDGLWNEIEKIKISADLVFLLQAHLLTVTKASDDYEEWTDYKKLDKFFDENFPVAFSNCAKADIVDQTKRTLSASSVNYVQEQAKRISTLKIEEMNLLNKMLAPEALRQDQRKKTLACQFYSMKAVMHLLQEKGAMMIVRKQMAQGRQPLKPLLFQSTGPTGPFIPVPDACWSKFTGNFPVVVMEGKIPENINREMLASYFEKVGLKEILLINTAQEDQYVQGESGLEGIPVAEGKEEITHYRKQAGAVNGLKGDKNATYYTDHVFCSSAQEEGIVQGVKK